MVPTTWAKLRCKVMPPKGWLTINTAMIDHLGWSRSKMKARYRVSKQATIVRRAKRNVSGPGCRTILK
ncbi:hypothetical protein D3C80_1923090 [compost metagenome]